MSLLTYIYTILLLSIIMVTTVLSQEQYLHNRPEVKYNIPLDIQCPSLTPRPPAESVHDLRPDDIRVVMGLGDSVLTGFAAKGIRKDILFNFQNLFEDRGVSFAMGGDPNITTVPNIMKYYSNNLIGASIGEHFITICFGDQVCPKDQFRPNLDRLNAALTGARSFNLDYQVNYMLETLQRLYENQIVKLTDWKLLTLFIGPNDLCHCCTETNALPTEFGRFVTLNIDKIRANVPNVFIQIIGMLKTQDIITATDGYLNDCEPIKGVDFVGHKHECECAHTAYNRTLMSNLFPLYNQALYNVTTQFQKTYQNDTFAVAFQPFLIDIASFPRQAISNVDCFHPSVIGHEWMAKMLWKMMFQTSAEKQEILKFSENDTIFCPTDNDRFQTN